MPVHSSCIGFPLASIPSIVTFVLNGKAISYLTVLFWAIPRPGCEFFAFSFQVPSNALPKQSAPRASQTARAIKEVLVFMAADEAEICGRRQCFSCHTVALAKADRYSPGAPHASVLLNRIANVIASPRRQTPAAH